MDNKKNIEMVDVSCFLLVEASGDSELDCVTIKQCDQSMDIASAAAAADEDDAESCSCDTVTDRLDDFYDVILQLDEDQDFIIDCNEPGIGWSCSSCNMWSLDEALGCISAEEEAAEDEKPRFGVNLCREVVDGMEDSVFWETCLAVGYP